MTTKYIGPGTTVDYTNATGVAIASGQPVLIGTRVGIAKDAIAIGAAGVLHVEGAWEITKLNTDVVTQGQALYFDNGNTRFTTTVGSNVLAGWAYAAAAGGSNTVAYIKLLG